LSISPSPTDRIVAIDLARSAALLGMAVFHFAYDLQMFGHLPRGTVASGGWRAFSILVAGSFLFLAGVSLVLAHGARLRWRAFGRRLARVAGAAALVSAGTYAVFPDRFVYFGILHSIAAASLIGLLFLRAPAGLTLMAACAALVAPHLIATSALPSPWFDWVGLTPVPRPSVDFEPLLPWLAPFLLGLAAAQAIRRTGVPRRMAATKQSARIWRGLAWPGRHSLIVYLLHQPVLLGLVWLATILPR